MEIESWLREKGGACSAEPAPSLAPGDVVAGWTVRAHLATGGTAEVYRVERDGAEAALKIARGIEQPRVEDRFAREADLLRTLDDSAFPTFIAQGSHAGRPFLVTELLQPLELPSGDGDVAELVVRLADALGRLHALGYVHRDVKPANLLTRDGTTPVLIDLGYARPFTVADAPDGSSRLSVERSRFVGLGTPGYAAPEQFTGLAVTPATDIHALGVLLDDCFNGRPPRVWQPLVLRSTSSLPARRYASMDVFARAVRRRHLRRNLALAPLVVLSLLAAACLVRVAASRVAERIDRPVAAEGLPDHAALLASFKAYDADLDPADPSAAGDAKTNLEKALAGDAQGMYQVAWNYAEGRGVKADPDRAEYWYRRAWAGGRPWALYELARLYLNRPERRAETVAVRLLEALSADRDFGYPGKYALWDLGRCHRDGVGTPKDAEKAAACWWRLLSVLPSGCETVTSRTLQDYRRNATEALERMGRLPPVRGCIGGDLDDGPFIVQFKRFDGSVEPYDPAARGEAKVILGRLRAGTPTSPHDLCVLGWEYCGGWSVARDPVRADYWFRRAWKEGDPWGVFALAEAYFDGTLGVRSPETAFRIFRVLSENPRYGYVQRYALCELGRCYQDGIGTARDREKARGAYERALDGYDASPRSKTARAYRAAAEYGLKMLGR